MTTSVSPPDAAPSQEPAASGGEQPTPTWRKRRRDRRELIALLKVAHRNLDAAGVPRTTPT